jgi:hypothetical protein
MTFLISKKLKDFFFKLFNKEQKLVLGYSQTIKFPCYYPTIYVILGYLLGPDVGWSRQS